MAQEEAERYSRRFNIPLCWLKQRLTDADIIEIARDLIDWEVKMAGPLELSRTDINDIKHKHREQPELQRFLAEKISRTIQVSIALSRREVLQLWKDRSGLDATYELLLMKCLKGKDAKTAENICGRLLAQGTRSRQLAN